MHIAPFATEKYFELYEFSAEHMLSASDCESMTIPELAELAGVDLASLLDLRLGYSPMGGDPALCSAVAATHKGVAAEDVLVVNAPEEGIFLTMHALLEPGDRVVCMTPCYDSLRNVAEYLRCQVEPWPLSPTADGWEWDLGSLEKQAAGAKMVVVNLPHNPTGFLPSREEFERLCTIVAKSGAILFCDEMYRGLEMPGVERLVSAAGTGDNTVVLAGLSKAQGLPGLRSGWLVVPDAKKRKAISDWKNYTTICAPTPVQALARIAVQHQDALFAKNSARVASNSGLAAEFFARDGYNYRPPKGGSIALVETSMDDTEPFCHRLAKEHGVVLLPGSCLGAPKSFVRIGLGRDGFADGLGALALLL